MIAPEFTPSSYPPALRARFFAQHLPEFGWNPIVLTTDPRNYEASFDPENVKLLNDSLEVIRTGALPVKWTRKLGFTDISLRTLWPHWRALNQICREKNVDLILVSVPPNFSIALARLAHSRFKIPYILDYNDPITAKHYGNLPRHMRPPKWGIVRTLYGILEPFALRRVAQIVGVADSYIEGLYSKYPWLKRTSGTPIPFGVEPKDFDHLRANPRKNSIFDRTDGHFHISHVGAGGPEMGNVLRAFFKAIKDTRQSSPYLFRKVMIHFVGTTYAANAEGRYQILPFAREFGVDDIVQEHPGRVPHLEAIQILLDSDALIIIGSEARHYTASKIFPSILAAKPLLAILHDESHAGKLLRELGAGIAITFGIRCPLASIQEEISGGIKDLLCSPPGWHPPTRWEKFELYTARAVTARLAEIFDRTLKPSTTAEASHEIGTELLN